MIITDKNAVITDLQQNFAKFKKEVEDGGFIKLSKKKKDKLNSQI